MISLKIDYIIVRFLCCLLSVVPPLHTIVCFISFFQPAACVCSSFSPYINPKIHLPSPNSIIPPFDKLWAELFIVDNDTTNETKSAHFLVLKIH